jgi:hypothetical protein
MSNRNREAGHSYERDCIKSFQKVGYKHVKSSRQVNRSRDAQKIDLANEDELETGRFPFNVQCKNVAGTLHYLKVMGEIAITPGIKNVVLHKHTKKVGQKFMTQGRYAFMYEADFFALLEEIHMLRSQINAGKTASKPIKNVKDNRTD